MKSLYHLKADIFVEKNAEGVMIWHMERKGFRRG